MSDDKDVKRRGWSITRSSDYDLNDSNSKYYNMDIDAWRQGVYDEWSRLASQKGVEWCSFIFHDSDLKRDENGKVELDSQGNPVIKPLHAHAVVKFKNGRYQNAVMKDWCGNNDRLANCAHIDSRKGGYVSALLYLTHHTTSAYKAKKTWYHHANVVQFGKAYQDLIKRNDRKSADNKEEMAEKVDEYVEKIYEGEMVLSDAKQAFKAEQGSSALVKYRAWFEAAFDEFRQNKTKEMQKLSDAGLFEKQTTYISGASQAGKSALASRLAIDLVGENEVFTAPAGGSNDVTSDFVDGYETEEATIFNDVDPEEYAPKAFYNMFDPHKWSLTKSRNQNKPWLSRYCYIAVAMPFGDFIIQMFFGNTHGNIAVSEQGAFELKQAFRRVQYLVHFGNNDMGDNVVWLARLKDDMPDEHDVVNYANSNLSGHIDSRIVGVFYETLGYVPYDATIKKSKPFHDERSRIASIINQVFAGDYSVRGFVQI